MLAYHDISISMAQGLQAKYYPYGNFRASFLGGRPSYLWRCLLEGCNLLSLDLRRRIDNASPLISGLINGSPPSVDFLLHLSSFPREWRERWLISLISIKVSGEKTLLGTIFYLTRQMVYSKFLSTLSSLMISWFGTIPLMVFIQSNMGIKWGKFINNNALIVGPSSLN